jgi:hypothetical protein
MRWRRAWANSLKLRWGGDILAVAAGGVVSFAIGNFGVLLAWREVLVTLSRYVARDSAGSTTAYLTNAGWYLFSLWSIFSMGPLLATLVVGAVLIASWQGPPERWIVLSFVWAVFLILPAVLFFWSARYSAIAYPGLLLAVGALVMRIWARLATLRPRLQSVALPVAALLLLAVPNLAAVRIYYDAVTRTPTRELARQWIMSHIPSGTKIVIDSKHMSPSLPLAQTSLQDKYGKYGYGVTGSHGGGPSYELIYLQLHNEKDSITAATLSERLDRLAQDGFTYVVYTDALPPAERVRLEHEDLLGTLLHSECELVNQFVYPELKNLPDDTATVNPEVRIYRLSLLRHVAVGSDK